MLCIARLRLLYGAQLLSVERSRDPKVLWGFGESVKKTTYRQRIIKYR